MNVCDACVYVSVKVCVKCSCSVLNHLCTKVCALCVGVCVVCFEAASRAGGTSAHSGTGLLPLHTAPAEQRFTA